jgi:hypothetical protein
VSKSTTGAYGDFPDYYYERGNQFSTYLRGGAPTQSWDQRMERTLVANTGPIVHTKRPGGAGRPAPKPRSARMLTSPLLTFARSTMTRREIHDLAVALGKEYKVDVVRLAAKDPLGALATALSELTPRQEQRELQRLRERGTSAMPTPKPVSKPKHRRNAKRRDRPSPTVPVGRSRAPQKVRSPTHCSVCAAPLTDEDLLFWSANRPVFFEHGYCEPCGRKLLAVFGAS